jgi:glutamate dehydrogenase
VGSKGGFVLKRPPPGGDREALMKEGVACYQAYLRGLLDLTDNLVGGAGRAAARTSCATTPTIRTSSSPPTRARPPSRHRQRRRRPNTGSGSATPSPPAAPAGYDHKKMAITARGAWESVKRHFRSLGHDTQSQPFTVVGVGDMSGDVFGNGMLLSVHIRLLAAFDHRHIFIDPDPDPVTSFAERERLFNLPRSSWADYDTRLVSAGGGVYPRSAKSIAVSPEARAALGIEVDTLTTRRADARHPAGAGGPVLQRRHRHLREGGHRDPRRRGRPRQRRDPRQRRRSCAARSSPRAATSAARSAGASSMRCAAG